MTNNFNVLNNNHLEPIYSPHRTKTIWSLYIHRVQQIPFEADIITVYNSYYLNLI
jgi:hypothetical protein